MMRYTWKLKIFVLGGKMGLLAFLKMVLGFSENADIWQNYSHLIVWWTDNSDIHTRSSLRNEYTSRRRYLRIWFVTCKPTTHRCSQGKTIHKIWIHMVLTTMPTRCYRIQYILNTARVINTILHFRFFSIMNVL